MNEWLTEMEQVTEKDRIKMSLNQKISKDTNKKTVINKQ